MQMITIDDMITLSGADATLTQAQNEEMVHNMQQLQKRNKELRQQLQAQQMPAPPAYMEKEPY